jgi:capsular exopolysaccharide synthesis family protein
MNRTLHGQAPPAVLEGYSLARANLALALRQFELGHPVGSWTIMVTSAVPGEGKSFTSAQLARSLARSGKSVILVDADMRRPTLAKLFHSEQERGLADVLAGNRTVAEVLEPSDIELLALMHSGRPEINPTDLISRPQMESTLLALKKAADFVIIDTPACSVVADALLLAQHVDCILHVVGAGKVDDDIVRETAAALQSAGPKSMLYVMNGGARKSHYGYQKYYTDWTGGANGSASRQSETPRLLARLEPPRPQADESTAE